MLKRPFKSLIARIAIIALALSLVFPFVPAAFAQDTSREYAENGTAPVAVFNATDADGDAIVWTLSGDDADLFTIIGGVLAFKSSPDYEMPNSASVGTLADKNVYNVTIEATGGTHDVVVTVTNVDEDGTIGFDGDGQFQPQVSRSLTANLTDQDGGVTDEVWQWARSADGETWEDIMGATSQNRAPTDEDDGSYLRASVTYTDMFDSGKAAAKVTTTPVEDRTVANAAPSFADQDDVEDVENEVNTVGTQVNREVAENSAEGTPIGKPVSASDADNDILVYTLGGDHASSFDISSTSGQLKSKAMLDFEDGANPGDDQYMVTVTATDPSGAATPQPVTIQLTDANEAPVFDTSADDGIQGPPTELNVIENDVELRDGTTVLTGNTYGATDEDDAETAVAYDVQGTDAKYFVITPEATLMATGLLTMTPTTKRMDFRLLRQARSRYR